MANPVATAAIALMTDPSWPGDSRPPANQLSVETQRVLQLDHTDPGEAGRHLLIARVGRDAIDVGGGQARIGDRFEHSVDGEVEGIPVDAATDL